MEFLYSQGNVQCLHDSVIIVFNAQDVTINSQSLQFPGEYEVSDILARSEERYGPWVYVLRVGGLASGKTVGYISGELPEEMGDMLEYLGNCDILVLEANTKTHTLLEMVEPKVAILFGDTAAIEAQKLANSGEIVSKLKLKESDFQAEKMPVIVLG